MADDKGRAPEPETKQAVELPEGIRKGLDMVDPSTPQVDQFRPHLDAPQQSTTPGDTGGQGGGEGSGGAGADSE